MKYIVHYIERIGRSFIVDADTCIDAMDKVKNCAEARCFELTLDDYFDTDIDFDEYWNGAEEFYSNIDELTC